jgi:hypothetical protein
MALLAGGGIGIEPIVTKAKNLIFFIYNYSMTAAHPP